MCFVQLYPSFFLIIIVYLLTTTRERAKVSVEDPPGGPRTPRGCEWARRVGLSLDRVRAWHYTSRKHICFHNCWTLLGGGIFPKYSVILNLCTNRLSIDTHAHMYASVPWVHNSQWHQTFAMVFSEQWPWFHRWHPPPSASDSWHRPSPMAARQAGSCLWGHQGERVPMYVHTCACERTKCNVNTSCGKNYSGTFPLLRPSEFKNFYYTDNYDWMSQIVSHRNVYLLYLQSKDTSPFHITDACSSPKWTYCVAGNFRGRKLSQISKKWPFHGENYLLERRVN